VAVYQALFGNYAVYVMPYDKFISEVDHQKYPKIKQQYCFEQIEFDENSASDIVTENSSIQAKPQMAESTAKQLSLQAYTKEADHSGVDPRLLMFLDARTYEEKLNVLAFLRNGLDDKLVDAMAVSLDIEVPAGDIDSRYMSLRRCILAHARYEGSRLR